MAVNSLCRPEMSTVAVVDLISSTGRVVGTIDVEGGIDSVVRIVPGSIVEGVNVVVFSAATQLKIITRTSVCGK